MAILSKAQKKAVFVRRLVKHMTTHDKFLIVSADNVGSNHIQDIRSCLRPGATLLMGKNTLIRRALRNPDTLGIEPAVSKNPAWDSVIPHVKGNIGFVFAKDDLIDVKDRILKNVRGAPAKAGAIAPLDVIVPKGPTGMDPTQTSFFQALNIATMISRGQIEIKADVHLIKVGDKVGASEATLLTKLNIRPFAYGLKVLQAYEAGSLFDAKILDITPAHIIANFTSSLRDVAALSLQIGIPTVASVPHSLANTFKALLAISVETAYTFKQAAAIKAYLADPSAFAAVATSSVSSSSAAPAAAVVEEKEESEADVGAGGLFGGGDAAADY